MPDLMDVLAGLPDTAQKLPDTPAERLPERAAVFTGYDRQLLMILPERAAEVALLPDGSPELEGWCRAGLNAAIWSRNPRIAALIMAILLEAGIE